MNLRKYVRLSLFLALAIILSIVESYIPILNGYIPGIKLGLANIIIIVILYHYSFKDAILISILRVFLVGMLRTGLFSLAFFFSITGAILSISIMFLTKKIGHLSIVGVSISGSIGHSIGQVLVASLILSSNKLFYYIPIIIILSIITGVIIGLVSKEILKQIKLL